MQIVMPKLGLTMTQGTLTRWLAAAGEMVRQGQILFEFESDKALMEFECPADGTLIEILVAEGETVPCGTPVALLEIAPTRSPAPQASPAASTPAQNILPNQPATAQPLPAPTHQSILATPAAKRRARQLGVDLAQLAGRGPLGRIQLADVEQVARPAPPSPPRPAPVITPLARRLASELGVDWSQLSGSGPGGRVVKDDILHAAARPEPVSSVPYTVEPLTGIRRVIARHMTGSAFTAPHVTLFTEADASALVEARTQLNAELASITKISYNTLLIAVVARALREHPHLNACLVGDEIRRYQEIHIALAVDTGRGLLAPVIRQADRLDLVNIQRASQSLIERALAGQSLPDDLTGGTFTLTNLGMFEVDGFTPIINQPQAAILGVGRIVAKAVAVDLETVAVRQMVTLSLSFDHRLVDGGPAARFLQRVKQLIERPFALVLPLGN